MDCRLNIVSFGVRRLEVIGCGSFAFWLEAINCGTWDLRQSDLQPHNLQPTTFSLLTYPATAAAFLLGQPLVNKYMQAVTE